MRLGDWTKERELARVLDLRHRVNLLELEGEYGRPRPVVLRGVLAQALAAGAQTAVVEYRYLDADYRNEHSRFYSTTFRRYPSVAHRIHFFADDLVDAVVDQSTAAAFGGREYVGYSVMRPVPGGPVGRTLLRPPSDLDQHVSCKAADTAHVFGASVTVAGGAPFIAQDAQLSRCAHATLWVVAHYHHLRFRHPRFLPGEIADAVPTELGLGRPLPSKGLNVFQIAEAARRIGLPALLYLLDDPPPGESLFSLACRYLNSAIPVIVAGGGHAWVLVGYRRMKTEAGDERIEFVRQDDEVGPYQLVPNAQLDQYAPWDCLIVPLPSRVYVSGEDAEVVGRLRLEASLSAAGPGEPEDVLRSLRPPNRTRRLRSTLLRSNDFKEGLSRVSGPLRVVYQRLQLPRWIWVVEVVDAAARDRGMPCVVAEAIIDATDHLRDMRVLAWRIPGEVGVWWPDLNEMDRIQLPFVPLLDSVSWLPG